LPVTSIPPSSSSSSSRVNLPVTSIPPSSSSSSSISYFRGSSKGGSSSNFFSSSSSTLSKSSGSSKSFIGGYSYTKPKNFWFPKIKINEKIKIGKLKAKRKYFYTPSAGALVKGNPFKIYGETSKRFTGLEFRGAPKKTKSKRRKKK
jgi:hypothetical protein